MDETGHEDAETGADTIDDALAAALAQLDERPVADRGDEYARLHEDLRRELGQLDNG